MRRAERAPRTRARRRRAARRPTGCRVTSIASIGRQRREDRRQAPGEHRLAGAGRAVQVEVVAARGGDLERRDQPVVAADVREVQLRGRLALLRRRLRRRRRLGLAAQEVDRLLEVRGAEHRELGDQRGLGARRRAGRAAAAGRAARALGDRQRAADRPAARRSATARRRPRSPRRSSGASWPPATSSATASGRSKPGPILRRSAGARLTVMRPPGNTKPEFTSAARTRSRASRTALSASPTTVNAGRPLAGCRPRPRPGGSSRRRRRRC